VYIEVGRAGDLREDANACKLHNDQPQLLILSSPIVVAVTHSRGGRNYEVKGTGILANILEAVR